MKRDSSCSPGVEALLRNRLLRLERRIDFGWGHLSRTSARSQRTNPRPKSVKFCRDIRELMVRACWAEQDAHIGNRLLRPARRSDFGPGRRSSVFRRSWNTNPREERVRISRCSASDIWNMIPCPFQCSSLGTSWSHTSLRFMTKVYLSEKVILAYSWDMSHHMTWISKFKMFEHDISSCYLFELSDKYSKCLILWISNDKYNQKIVQVMSFPFLSF